MTQELIDFTGNAQRWLDDVTFNSWTFHIGRKGEVPYLWLSAKDGIDNVTGEPLSWNSRKWMLSIHMTKDEVIQTAFKAVMTAMEHEVREQFLYKGVSVFDPHYNLDYLAELRRKPNALSMRAAPRPLGEVLGPTENVGSVPGWPGDPNAPVPPPIGSSFGV